MTPSFSASESVGKKFPKVPILRRVATTMCATVMQAVVTQCRRALILVTQSSRKAVPVTGSEYFTVKCFTLGEGGMLSAAAFVALMGDAESADVH